MAHEIVMPQMGLSMDSGYIVRWIKQPGESVATGDPLLEIEGDKATVEVESVESGILQVMRGPADGAIAVGEVIGYLLEDAPEGQPEPQPESGAEPGPAPEARNRGAIPTTLMPPHLARPPASTQPVENQAGQASVGPLAPGATRRPASPAARRRAQELGVDWRAATGTGPGGAVKERDVVRLAGEPVMPLGAEGRVRISPIAQRLAETAGLDVLALAARMPGRRIEREDVEAALAARIPGAPAAQEQAATRETRPATGVDQKRGQRQQMTRLRRLIAERMARSAQTSAAVTLTTEADASDLVRLREGRKVDPLAGFVPSYNAMFAKLVAKALVEQPGLNATLDGVDIVYWDTVNIAIAVDTERGLVTPVFRDVQETSLADLTRAMDERLARAREGKALPDELKDSTFTITNLGVYEIDAFTPIINPPESAILGVGRLVERIVPIGGQPAIRTMVALSLTFDHRLVDGGPAARFLQRVKQLVEQPYLWLI